MLRRDEGFYIPLLSFPDRRILFLKNPAFVPQLTSQNPPVLLPQKSICHHTLPCCRARRQPLSSVSRKQRYNTLDFPAENRVPTGMLAPLLETQRQRDVPFEIPHFLRRRICKLQKQQLENKKTLQSSPYNWTKIAAFYHTQCKQKVGSHFNSIDIRYPISTNITITER